MNAPKAVISTGIEGLDEILDGGLPRDHVYLIQGDPGAGKTTLSMQFLMAGRDQGETALYITLAESKGELLSVAESHGWNLEGVSIYEQLVGEEMLSDSHDMTLFHPSEVELGETVNKILQEIERLKPKRVVLDSLSEIRLLSQSSHRYRKQILALKAYLANRKITALFLDDRTSEQKDLQLHSVPHGVIVLERLAPVYGAPRRRLEVVKVRGVHFRGGYHDFTIKHGGIQVYPRPRTTSHDIDSVGDHVSSGIPEIDRLSGGGIRRGNSTLIMGPAGVGKSTLATQYAVASAERGDKAAIFAFDESLGTLFMRSGDLGMPLRKQVENGDVIVQQIDPAEMSPGEFTKVVRDSVQKQGVKLVVIDSLNGYLNAMPEESFLTLHLHELLGFLGECGVVTIIVMAQHGLIGSNMTSSVDISYLADCVILLRYFEVNGGLKKAISVLKKRSGNHERLIREYSMKSEEGLLIGDALQQFRGILTGVPVAVHSLKGDPYSTE